MFLTFIELAHEFYIILFLYNYVVLISKSYCYIWDKTQLSTKIVPRW